MRSSAGGERRRHIARRAAAAAQRRQALTHDLGVVEERDRQQRTDAAGQAGDLAVSADRGTAVEHGATVEAFQMRGQLHRSADGLPPRGGTEPRLADERGDGTAGEVRARHRHPRRQLPDRLEHQPGGKGGVPGAEIEMSAGAVLIQRVDPINEEKSHGAYRFQPVAARARAGNRVPLPDAAANMPSTRAGTWRATIVPRSGRAAHLDGDEKVGETS